MKIEPVPDFADAEIAEGLDQPETAILPQRTGVGASM